MDISNKKNIKHKNNETHKEKPNASVKSNSKSLSKNENNKIENQDYLEMYRNNLKDKLIYFQEIIKRTILSCQQYKLLEIINATDLNTNITILEKLFTLSTNMQIIMKDTYKIDLNALATKLQGINDELSTIFKSIGTEKLDDLINICFGNNYTF
jgi:hypothetical protein